MSEAAWAAGFFDGEGHAGSARGGYPQIMVTQRTQEPLERFRDAVGAGRIYETELRGKPLYHYCAYSIADAARVCAVIGPHVCVIKARQIDKMWEAYRELRKTRAPRGSAEHHRHMSEAAKKKPRPSGESEARRHAAVRAFYSTPEGRKSRSEAAKLGWQRRKERAWSQFA